MSNKPFHSINETEPTKKKKKEKTRQIRKLIFFFPFPCFTFSSLQKNQIVYILLVCWVPHSGFYLGPNVTWLLNCENPSCSGFLLGPKVWSQTLVLDLICVNR